MNIEITDLTRRLGHNQAVAAISQWARRPGWLPR
jgi:hypothetical protein